MKVLEYVVVMADSHKALTQYVNERISDGWQPQGGVSTMPAVNAYTNLPVIQFTQAMVLTG